jgi:TetR/AcrR family transcriptional regulator, fatty acid metabolism regulator protein
MTVLIFAYMSKTETIAERQGRARPSATFTEAARRLQIVQATITTIAEVGYRRASYAQIAKRAGLSSTGLISYHFASKAELLDQVIGEVVAAGQGFMLPRIEAAAPGRGRLRAYITSNLEFMAAHPAHMRAAAEILNALPREPGGQAAPYAPRHARGLAQLEGYLREGQRNGQFRRFSVAVMALAIRAAIDAVAYRLADEPDLDLAAYARELAAMFDQATTARPAGGARQADVQPRSGKD